MWSRQEKQELPSSSLLSFIPLSLSPSLSPSPPSLQPRRTTRPPFRHRMHVLACDNLGVDSCYVSVFCIFQPPCLAIIMAMLAQYSSMHTATDMLSLLQMVIPVRGPYRVCACFDPTTPSPSPHCPCTRHHHKNTPSMAFRE